VAPNPQALSVPQRPTEVKVPAPPARKTGIVPSVPAPPKAAKDTGVTVTIPPDNEGVKPRRKPRHTPAATGGRLALIIDDIGMSTGQLRPFLDLPAELTFSIIPETSQARRCLSLVKSRGRLSMLHLPMESFHRTELLPSDAIMVNLSGGEIERRVGKMLTQLQGVEGVNNHMGSKATQDERVMESVLSVVKQRGLFFVDSKTSQVTAVSRVADELGVPHAARSGEFLDDGGNTSRTYQIVLDLAREAQRNGSAIGIGHPHPGTLRAIARALPEVEAMGVRIVPVSELTR
jgi:polysaccharide deacetylase 2 family uncharacterized protein YibQ